MDTAAPTAVDADSPRASRRLRTIFFVVAVVLIAAVVGAAVYTYQSYQGATTNEALYQNQIKKLNNDLSEARAAGYTKANLTPIVQGEHQVLANGAPVTPWQRNAYYQSQAVKVAQLQGALQGLLPQVMVNGRNTIAQDVTQANAILNQNASEGGDISTMQAQLTQIQQDAAAANTIRQINSAQESAQTVIKQATAQAATLKQETAQIQAAATQLLAQTTDQDTLRADGQAALVQGNNDASLAAYQNFGNRFKDYTSLMASYDRLQYFSNQLGSVDTNALAFAVAAEQMYMNQIHTTLINDLPAQFIVVNWTAQQIWAYQNGQVAQTTLVTTGIRGTSTDGTDFGPMQILHKNSPWTMVSPWPQGSSLYYPPTTVAYASFFTDSGEAIHDATWEPDSAMGPGSQNDAAYTSHGCVHVPVAVAAWFYNWVNVGTQMDVYLGDGSSVANQLSYVTTDAQGNPLDPA